MTDPKTHRPTARSGGEDAAAHGPLAGTGSAGEPGAGPDHRRHEASAESTKRSAKGPKPYTSEIETYADDAVADPRDPAQRADARRGPIA